MGNKDALRALQARLAERMRSAQAQPGGPSWLAVECRGHGLLFPLEQAGEIFSPPPLLPVPHTAPWFAGVANLRGGLYAVVDLGRFLGLADTPPPDAARDASRLVVLSARAGVNAALLVDRLAGLRHGDQLTSAAASAQAQPPFAGATYHDAEGRAWQEILLTALAENERFLTVAA